MYVCMYVITVRICAYLLSIPMPITSSSHQHETRLARSPSLTSLRVSSLRPSVPSPQARLVFTPRRSLIMPCLSARPSPHVSNLASFTTLTHTCFVSPKPKQSSRVRPDTRHGSSPSCRTARLGPMRPASRTDADGRVATRRHQDVCCFSYASCLLCHVLGFLLMGLADVSDVI